MPAARWGTQAIDVGRFDVLGFDAVSPANFVRHIGLASDARMQVVAGTAMLLTHMGPPLEREESHRIPETWGATNLTVDEQNRINLFIDERIQEHEAASLRRDRQYIIRPHARPEREADGTIIHWLYSCAGFAVEAYRSAELNVVSTSDELLPTVSLDAIEQAYPGAREHSTLRDRWGIPGDGPWPILLAGHLLHALARTVEEIRREPYRPQSGDEIFPR